MRNRNKRHNREANLFQSDDMNRPPQFTWADVRCALQRQSLSLVELQLRQAQLFGLTGTGPQQQQPLCSQQQPFYGQQQPLYGQQEPLYGQQQPLCSQQQPLYGQQQPLYGEQQPLYGQQQPLCSSQQPSQAGQAYAAEAAHHPWAWHEQAQPAPPQPVHRQQPSQAYGAEPAPPQGAFNGPGQPASQQQVCSQQSITEPNAAEAAPPQGAFNEPGQTALQQQVCSQQSITKPNAAEAAPCQGTVKVHGEWPGPSRVDVPLKPLLQEKEAIEVGDENSEDEDVDDDDDDGPVEVLPGSSKNYGALYRPGKSKPGDVVETAEELKEEESSSSKKSASLSKKDKAAKKTLELKAKEYFLSQKAVKPPTKRKAPARSKAVTNRRKVVKDDFSDPDEPEVGE